MARKNEQLVCDIKHGDCFRACLLGLLDMPNSEIIPSCSADSWFAEYYKFLKQFGLTINYEKDACWRNGYLIASVKSLNFPNVTHAIIMNGSEIYWDPSPKQKYSIGEGMLGKNIVLGGWYLEVEDFSKLHNFLQLQTMKG